MIQPDFLDRLEVMKAADELVLAVYQYTKDFPKDEQFGLVSQMRRAAVSVPANIAEGYSRNTTRDKLQFYYVSRGSLTELKYYIQLAMKLNFLNKSDAEKLLDKIGRTAKLLTGFISYTSNRQSPIANRSSSGQSLIETIVAIFILTTGLTAGLALAIYAFGGSSEITERVTATALAREGIEAVRRMRDSNWLRDTLTSGGSCGSGQLCYRDWLRESYDIRGRTGTSGQAYRLTFDPAVVGAAKWQIRTGGGGDFYRLYRQPAGALTHSNISGGQPTSFFRKVTIIDQQSSSPPRILVRSTVWWYGKKCDNLLTDLTNPSQTPCKIISEEYLTNWRNY